MADCHFTSLEVPWAGALTGVRGLVTDTGLVKAESRPEKCKPTLVSLPLGFHGPDYKQRFNLLNENETQLPY